MTSTNLNCELLMKKQTMYLLGKNTLAVTMHSFIHSNIRISVIKCNFINQ